VDTTSVKSAPKKSNAQNKTSFWAINSKSPRRILFFKLNSLWVYFSRGHVYTFEISIKLHIFSNIYAGLFEDTNFQHVELRGPNLEETAQDIK